MKIIVTGGAGFIGSAVVRNAVARGHSVINIDSLTYASCLKNVAVVENSPNYQFELADICNRASLENIFAIHQPDAVMHLAAESHVDRSIESPLNFIETNVNGTFNMLDISLSYWRSKKRSKYFRFLHVSTDEVFGSLPEDKRIKFTENSPYDPRIIR